MGKTSILEQLLYGNHVVGELLGMSCGGGSRSTKRFDHNTKRLKVAPGGAPRSEDPSPATQKKSGKRKPNIREG